MIKRISKLFIFAISIAIPTVLNMRAMTCLGPINANSDSTKFIIKITNKTDGDILVKVTYGYLSKVLIASPRAQVLSPMFIASIKELDSGLTKIHKDDSFIIEPVNIVHNGITWKPEHIECIQKIYVRPVLNACFSQLKSFFKSTALNEVNSLHTNNFVVLSNHKNDLEIVYTCNSWIKNLHIEDDFEDSVI